MEVNKGIRTEWKKNVMSMHHPSMVVHEWVCKSTFIPAFKRNESFPIRAPFYGWVDEFKCMCAILCWPTTRISQPKWTTTHQYTTMDGWCTNRILYFLSMCHPKLTFFPCTFSTLIIVFFCNFIFSLPPSQFFSFDFSFFFLEFYFLLAPHLVSFFFCFWNFSHPPTYYPPLSPLLEILSFVTNHYVTGMQPVVICNYLGHVCNYKFGIV